MTPGDVHAILDQAKADGADAEQLDALYARVLEACGGDEERLAREWSLSDALGELRELVAEGRRANLGHSGYGT